MAQVCSSFSQAIIQKYFPLTSVGKYLKSEKIKLVRVDGVNVKGKWKTNDGDKISSFPDSLGFSKDKGKDFNLAFDGKSLLGNLKSKTKTPYVCVEACEGGEDTTTEDPGKDTTTEEPASGDCGKGWTVLSDDKTCVM